MVHQMLQERNGFNKFEENDQTQSLLDTQSKSTRKTERWEMENVKEKATKEKMVNVFKEELDFSTMQQSCPEKEALQLQTDTSLQRVRTLQTQTSLQTKRSPQRKTTLQTGASAETFLCTEYARWETSLSENQLLSWAVTFLSRQSDGREFLLFCSVSSNLQRELQSNNNKLSLHLATEGDIITLGESLNRTHSVHHIENLSNVEEYFFQIGYKISDDQAVVVEAERLHFFFREYEIKQDCKIQIVSNFMSITPHILCSVKQTPDSENNSPVEHGDPRINVWKRSHHNPDEIIDGRPKWCAIKVVRSGQEETLDFDRLNPHRSFVAEFEEEFDNTDWRYNNTVLKMIADLNCETTVTLGDRKLKPDDEKKYLEEYYEWQQFKQEVMQNPPRVRLRKMKADKTVKIRQTKIIISKIPRKDFLYN